MAEDLASEVPFSESARSIARTGYLGWQFSAVGEIVGSSTGTTVDLATWGRRSGWMLERSSWCRRPLSALTRRSVRGRTPFTATSRIRCCRDAHPHSPIPLVYGYYFDGNKPGTQTESDVLASARLAHELGFETYLADAMWFPDTGDWRWDPKRFRTVRSRWPITCTRTA